MLASETSFFNMHTDYISQVSLFQCFFFNSIYLNETKESFLENQPADPKKQRPPTQGHSSGFLGISR